MDHIELDGRIKSVVECLDYRTRKLIHLRSIENFFIHFDSLTFQSKRDVLLLLKGFTEDAERIKREGYITNEVSKLLFKKYIRPMGSIYRDEAKFKVYGEFSTEFTLGILSGIIVYFLFLYIFSIKNIIIIPIILSIKLMHWIYVKYVFLNKNKVYGFKF